MAKQNHTDATNGGGVHNTLDRALFAIAEAATRGGETGPDGAQVHVAIQRAREEVMRLIYFSENEAIARHIGLQT